MTMELVCPYCRATLARYGNGQVEIVNGHGLTIDADVIPGSPDQAAGRTAMACALVGKCSECTDTYWFLECIVHPGTEEQLLNYLALNDGAAEEFRTVEGAGETVPWILWEAATESGRLQRHQIGPFRPAGSPLRAAGVSACGGGVFWQDALRRADHAWPALEAMARSA